MKGISSNPGPVAAAQLTLAWPEVLIAQIAEAVAARLGSFDERTQWMGVAEAATHLGMSEDAVRKAAQRKQLPSYQPMGKGQRYLFDRHELDATVRASRTDGTATQAPEWSAA